MKQYYYWLLTSLALFSFSERSEYAPDIDFEVSYYNVGERSCSSAFGGDVNTYTITDNGRRIGKSLWISRTSGRTKAKYFAHRQRGSNVHDRYTSWRTDGEAKTVVLKSSGAYATGFEDSDLPVGITVDNGSVVNRRYEDDMDGLVIVYATGGIAISNIEDGDLRLASLDREVDVSQYGDRNAFIRWAQSENATVFQTHLTIYKNELKVYPNASRETARRKFLVLARDSSGELFHVIFYLTREYSLYRAASLTLDYLANTKQMDVIAAVNLDTGGFDILNTGGDAKDCNDRRVWGSSNNYEDMTNLLTYEYE